jgi:hypothetical protein
MHVVSFLVATLCMALELTSVNNVPAGETVSLKVAWRVPQPSQTLHADRFTYL